MNNLPVLKPLLALLFSRKGITYIGWLIVGALVAWKPDLAPGQDIVFQFAYLVLTAVGGVILQVTIAWEDTAKRAREDSTTPVLPADAIKELVAGILEEYLRKQEQRVSASRYDAVDRG